MKNTIIFEKFFYGDKFYSDIESLSKDLFKTKEEIYQLPENYEVIVYGTKLEPICQFNPHELVDHYTEDRLCYENPNDDMEYYEILQILTDNIDFTKINSLIPKLYYEDPKKKFVLTKQHFIDTL